MKKEFKKNPLTAAIRYFVSVGAVTTAFSLYGVAANAQAPDAQRDEDDVTVDSPSLDSDGVVDEEVIVLGIQRSLQHSADIKRNAQQIVDAVTAEDMGKLPDDNAASSLKRITGVQIGNRNGQGSNIRIRGMSQVDIQVNGSTYVGTGIDNGRRSAAGRGISLEDIPSELLSGIEVIKSATADMTEGGLTGTVNLKTRRPLELDDSFVGGTFKNTFSDVANKDNQHYSLYLGKNWNDSIGMLLSVTDSTTLTRNDRLQYNNWGALQFEGADPEQPSTNRYLVTQDDQGRSAVVISPQSLLMEQRNIVQDKISVNYDLQLRPTDSLELFTNILYTEYEEVASSTDLQLQLYDISTRRGFMLNDFAGDMAFGEFTSGTTEAYRPEGSDEDIPFPVDGEITLTSAGFEIPRRVQGGDGHTATGRVARRDNENINIKLGGSWSNDILTLSALYSYGKAKFDSIFFDQGIKGSYGNVNCTWRNPRPLDPVTLKAVDCAENLRFAYDLKDGKNGNVWVDPMLSSQAPQLVDVYNRVDAEGKPAAILTADDIRGNSFLEDQFASHLSNGRLDLNKTDKDYLLDPYSYAIGFTGMFISEFVSQEDSFAFDGDWTIDKAGFTTIEFGVRRATRENSSENSRGVGEHFQAECSNPAKETAKECADDGAIFTDLRIGTEDANSLYIQEEDKQDVALITDGSYMDGVSGLESFGIKQWLGGNPNVYDDPIAGAARIWDMYPMRDYSLDYRIKEETTAFYLKGSFDFEQYAISGNFGVRVIETDQSSISYKAPIDDEGNPLVRSLIIKDDIYARRDFEVQKEKKSYTDVLPSLNVNWGISDEWSLRFAASRVMARADLGDLIPGDVVTSTTALTGRSGNPDLEPWRANTADLTLEWYFDEDTGGNVTTALFYKDFSSFISQVQGETFSCVARGRVRDCSSTTTENATGEVSGFELGYNQPLPLGFGIYTNYTYLDSADAEGLPIPGNSEHTYNVMAYYENYGFGARLAYQWQDDSLNTSSGFGGRPEYTRDRGQLDLSLNYDWGDSLSFTLAATNLTQEGETSYTQIEERLLNVQQFDRTVVFSVRGRF